MSEKRSLGEPGDHEARHGEVNPGFFGAREFLIVLAQASMAPQPAKGPFDHPAARQDLKPGGHWGWFGIDGPPDACRRLAHHLDVPTQRLGDPPHAWPLVGRIDPDLSQPREPVPEACQEQFGPVPIRHMGWMDQDRQQQTRGVDEDVALAPIYLLAAVVPPDPPFSVVLTDWLWRIAPVGWAFRPCRSRARSRNTVWMRSQVPSSRQRRK